MLIEQLCSLMLSDPFVTILVIGLVLAVIVIYWIFLAFRIASLRADVKYFESCYHSTHGRLEELKEYNNILSRAMWSLSERRFEIFIDGEDDDNDDEEDF